MSRALTLSKKSPAHKIEACPRCAAPRAFLNIVRHQSRERSGHIVYCTECRLCMEAHTREIVIRLWNASLRESRPLRRLLWCLRLLIAHPAACPEQDNDAPPVTAVFQVPLLQGGRS